MLQSLKQAYSIRLGATDGSLGHVKDFYFDDHTWTVRYVVIDTGTWLSRRKVLITPHSLGRLELNKGVLNVNLTRKQLEDSPTIDLHKPVSRQFEEDYVKYFGIPSYWLGDSATGMTEANVEASAQGLLTAANIPSGTPAPARNEPLLRSTLAVQGYHLNTTEGIVGHICDFMFDPDEWIIRQLVIKTGLRLSGPEVLVSATTIFQISYSESSAFTNLSESEVLKSPVHALAPAHIAS